MLDEGLINENNSYGLYYQKSLNVCFSSAIPVIHQAICMFTTCILVWQTNDASPTFNLAV